MGALCSQQSEPPCLLLCPQAGGRVAPEPVLSQTPAQGLGACGVSQVERMSPVSVQPVGTRGTCTCFLLGHNCPLDADWGWGGARGLPGHGNLLTEAVVGVRWAVGCARVLPGRAFREQVALG